MLNWSQGSAVKRVPGKVSSVWLFKGTRVPVKALFENLESGATVENFLESFPGVTRQQVEAVLEHQMEDQLEMTAGFKESIERSEREMAEGQRPRVRP
jgi:uncharacterized protein (DUF433 family)